MAVKLSTPPDGVTSLETGLAGTVVDGPRTVDGVVVVHTGLISDAVGAAGLPGICGDGPLAWAGLPSVTPTVSAVTTATTPEDSSSYCAIQPHCGPCPVHSD